MTARQLQFNTSWLLSILAVIVLWILISLAGWQVNRAEQKQALLDMQSERIGQAPTDVTKLDFSTSTLRYLPVLLQGTVDSNQQLLIENQVRHGQVGYFVLTPIKMANNKAILLNRGWVALGSDRSVLPDVAINITRLAVSGKLDYFPSVGIKLNGADNLTNSWPAVTHVINLEKVAARLGYDVLPYQVLMDSDQAYGYERQWLMMKMGPDKHYGYAFQWYAMALTWVIIYVVVSFKKGVRSNE